MAPIRPILTRNTSCFGIFRPFGRPSGAVTLRRRRIPTKNVAHSNQVIGREGKIGLRGNPLKTTEFRFPETADCLCPAEGFLNPFSDFETLPVPFMAGGPTVNGGAFDFLGHVGSDLYIPERFNKLRHVIALVRTQRGFGLQDAAPGHGLCRLPFRSTRSDRGFGINHQTRLVLHQDMPHVAKDALVTLALLVDPALRIRRRGVRFIAPALSLEVDGRVAPPVFWRVSRAIFRAESLHRGPGFNEGPIDREVFVRNQFLPFGQSKDAAKEEAGDLLIQQPIPVCREGRVIPYFPIQGQPNKPSVQQIEIDLLYQLPLGANSKKDLQQTGSKEAFRGYRAATCLGIKFREVSIHAPQQKVNHFAEFSNRVRNRYSLFQSSIAEQLFLGDIGAAHGEVSNG